MSSGPPLTDTPPPDVAGTLHVLATSDVHMALRGYDYLADRPTAQGGLARVATYLRHMRDKAAATGDLVIAVDNGDSLQGAPMDHLAFEEAAAHPFYHTLAKAGFDAAGLGNHDFDFGLDRLDRAVSAAPLPILSSNIRRMDRAKTPVDRLCILKRSLRGHPIRIGVFSVLPPQTMVWNADHLTGRLAIDDITRSAQAAIDALRNRDADVIIALAHTGTGEGAHVPRQENAVEPLSRLAGLDCIVAGHTHRLIARSDPPAIVMPGQGAEHLGHIKLTLRHSPAGWARVGQTAQLHRVVDDEAPDILRTLDDLHQRTRTRLARPIGQRKTPLHSYFGPLVPNLALAMIAEAQRRAIEAALPLPEGLPVLSAVPFMRQGGPSGSGHYTDIPAGPFLERHLHDLCPFANQLAAVVLTGAEIAQWIEMSAGLYAQILPDRAGQTLLDPDWPAHASDLIFGLDYCLDLSRPARFALDGTLVDPQARRVAALQVNGSPLRPDQPCVVILSRYRADGGGSVAAVVKGRRLEVPPLSLRQAVSEYVAQGKYPDPRRARPCRFSPLPAPDVIWRTGSGALAYLNALEGQLLRADPPGPDGFVDLHIRLQAAELANPAARAYIAG